MATFLLDQQPVPFRPGQTVLEAALDAGRYIPHLCWDSRLEPHSSCRLCTVRVDGVPFAACTQPAVANTAVASEVPELRAQRRSLLQMLFVEGSHVCATCEKSGDCRLQATAYLMGMQDNHFAPLVTNRRRDDSHPDLVLDLDRCILCELCVRASLELDHKEVFTVLGRGLQRTLAVTSPSGLLRDSAITLGDQAARICPVGAILVRGQGYQVPIGQRTFDRDRIDHHDLAQRRQEFRHG